MTRLAFPLTAVLTLSATPSQMGVLGAARDLPFLVVGLLAGVWVDRASRRRILIGTNLGSAALLGSIPIVAWLGIMRIEHSRVGMHAILLSLGERHDGSVRYDADVWDGPSISTLSELIGLLSWEDLSRTA